MSPEAAVQHQLEAYNARDPVRFLAVYSEDVRLYRLPAAEPAIERACRARHRCCT